MKSIESPCGVLVDFRRNPDGIYGVHKKVTRRSQRFCRVHSYMWKSVTYRYNTRLVTQLKMDTIYNWPVSLQ